MGDGARADHEAKSYDITGEGGAYGKVMKISDICCPLTLATTIPAHDTRHTTHDTRHTVPLTYAAVEASRTHLGAAGQGQAPKRPL